MSTFTDSIKRLYDAGRLTREQLDVLLANGKISQQEYDFITATASA